MSFASPKGEVSIPALAASYAGEPERLGDVPTIGQHTRAGPPRVRRLMARWLIGRSGFPATARPTSSRPAPS